MERKFCIAKVCLGRRRRENTKLQSRETIMGGGSNWVVRVIWMARPWRMVMMMMMGFVTLGFSW